MPTTLQEELFKMQRKLYKRNQRLIEESIHITEPNFRRYESRYKRRISKYIAISSNEEMLGAVMASDIIYVGDYHTCNQSQRSFLRILKEVVKKTKNFSVGLELIHAHNQKILDQYLSGKLGEQAFLKKIGLRQHWIFDLWPNFKPIFDFAKYHKIKLHALDAAKPNSSLQKRDAAAGKLIAETIANHPDQKLFVLIGDLHLAPQHLPAEVARALAKSPPPDLPPQGGGEDARKIFPSLEGRGQGRVDVTSLTLYQNSEPIYWKLAKLGIEDHVEVVKIDGSSFCRMHTPPVIAQQSYINWLEHEEGEIDFSDAKHSFLELVHRIASFLDLKLGKEKDNVEVYTSGDLSFLKKLKKKKAFSKKEFDIVKRQILSSESYYLANERIVYLGNLSLNHAAEEASHFIKSICSGPEFPRTFVDAFYANILHEALGFFGSKLINPHRKCLHEDGFKKLFAFLRTIEVPDARVLEFETARLVTEYLEYEKRGRPLKFTEVFEQSPDLFMAITHALGYILGDKMYYAMKAEKLKRLTIRYMFYDKWEEEGRPLEAYLSMREQVKDTVIPKRM